jgi:hypothetical protein
VGEKVEEVENIAFVDDELVTDILDIVNHNNNKYILFRLLSSIIRNIISELKLSVKMYLGKLNRIRNDIASTDAFFVVCYCFLLLLFVVVVGHTSTYYLWSLVTIVQIGCK